MIFGHNELGFAVILNLIFVACGSCLALITLGIGIKETVRSIKTHNTKTRGLITGMYLVSLTAFISTALYIHLLMK